MSRFPARPPERTSIGARMSRAGARAVARRFGPGYFKDMPGLRLTYDLVIREGHLDSYGHVNNATYLALYEEARWEYITSRGYGYEKVHETGIGPVILEINIKFRKELRLRERISISGEVTEYKGPIGKMRQEMVDSSGALCSSAEFVFALFDLRARKLVAPTPEWMRAVGWSPAA